MQPRPFRWAAWSLAVFAVATAVPAAWLTVFAVAKARLPYNEEGNHFDGLVVHHEGTAVVYGALAVVLWVVAVLAGLGARRVFKRAPGAVNENAQG
ncbi:hypothetical protein [Hydrogenophaga sp.]|uniref:hypothetical protein n=1 Tax=Hydrogenophaga sp. TaxID=1904254 RepID=UPI0027306F11|nr:hypothetical protein [Hydrogenophaga sp.]MDP2072756.1 hypothetical protein [Hydrogenophaga sp.]MDP3110395.1 hypothetical protein [Hydrogenophaga sp.]MDP3348715.1 hypothetical protein [Hydrogenophaga sp.]MDZ4281389.1 hypothetical protein [Hydrogenophaga sp.]